MIDINSDTLDFIRKHRSDDVSELALSAGRNTNIDMPFALDQIAGWQTACRKLPSWSKTDGIIYPPHLSMEQCSSEQTASYKASRTPVPPHPRTPELVDLTGGFAVDFSFLASKLSADGEGCVYVEKSRELCEIAQHNLPLLGLPKAQVANEDGIDFLHQLQHTHIIYIDPARRDSNGARTYAIGDCTPNVVELCDELLGKADIVMIKLSPMLDWHKAVNDLRCVREVHIVSVANECKELILILSAQGEDSVRLFCVNDDVVFESENISRTPVPSHPRTSVPPHPRTPVPPKNWLYVPNASIMKAGCFDELISRFGVEAVSPNSHLFVSSDEIADFPGRRFCILAVSSMNKRELKSMLKVIDSANIAVRNFPLSVAELRKRLRLKDGGDKFIFATTDSSKNHILILCSKDNL